MTLDALVAAEVVTAATARAALELAHKSGAHVIECLVAVGADEKRVAEQLARGLGAQPLPPERLRAADEEALAAATADLALEFLALPFGRDEDGTLFVAVADPLDAHALQELAFFVGAEIAPVVATVSALRASIESYYAAELPRARVMQKSSAAS